MNRNGTTSWILAALSGASLASAADLSALNAQIAGSANLPLDYVIQDVCVNGSDRVIEGDPATCSNHRNIRIGEKVPYLVTDIDTANGNAIYQALSSYPVPGTDGSLKVMVTKYMGPGIGSGFQFSFDYHRDGYDLMDTTGSYFSFIRTSDGGCYDQLISGESQRQNGWILFPTSGGNGSLAHGITITRTSPDLPSACGRSSHSAQAEDIWNPPVATTFESGKQLQSIITYHYAEKDLSNAGNALERYFFTREYGFTRWEAWVPLSHCQSANLGATCDPTNAANFLRGRCGPTSPIPATAQWGGQTWVRIDCRDSTHYIALHTPTVLIDGQMAQNDGTVDVDPAAIFGQPGNNVPPHSVTPPSSPIPGGSYQQSCQSCSVSGHVLSCSCRNTHHQWGSAHLDLSTCAPNSVSNLNGGLVCTHN